MKKENLWAMIYNNRICRIFTEEEALRIINIFGNDEMILRLADDEYLPFKFVKSTNFYAPKYNRVRKIKSNYFIFNDDEYNLKFLALRRSADVDRFKRLIGTRFSKVILTERLNKGYIHLLQDNEKDWWRTVDIDGFGPTRYSYQDAYEIYKNRIIINSLDYNLDLLSEEDRFSYLLSKLDIKQTIKLKGE